MHNRDMTIKQLNKKHAELSREYFAATDYEEMDEIMEKIQDVSAVISARMKGWSAQ